MAIDIQLLKSPLLNLVHPDDSAGQLPADSLGESHQVHVRLKYPDTAEVIANAEVAIQLNAVSGAFLGEGINVPQVIDLVPIQFTRPGQVDVQVSIDDEPAGDLSFWLLPAVVKT